MLLVAVAGGAARGATVDLLTVGNLHIRGAATDDDAGFRVAAAGDVNGDGRPDLLIGAPGADPGDRDGAGAAYVVFGGTAPATVDLLALGTHGYAIQGAARGDGAGSSVANAGDVNGDGRPDALVGAPFAAPAGRPLAGSAYVVYGQSASTSIDLADLGSHGYRLDGGAREAAGWSVGGAGDVNGDGVPDLLVGALSASRKGAASGAAYVVFGRPRSGPVDLPANEHGFRIDGAPGDNAGWAVAGGGDVNGDGREDVLVGALNAGANGRDESGSVYVVFGRGGGAVDLAGFGAAANRDGYRIDGAHAGDQAGVSTAGAGDVNGDGRADTLVGALNAAALGRRRSGAAYVVFGKTSSASIDLSAFRGKGYAILGAAYGDAAGTSVGSAGDVDGDGAPDALVGAPAADAVGRVDSGSAYLVYGKADSAAVDLCALGTQGERFDGATPNDFAGSAAAGLGAGALGHSQIAVGAPRMSDGDRYLAGAVYVVDLAAPTPTDVPVRRGPPRTIAKRCEPKPPPRVPPP